MIEEVFTIKEVVLWKGNQAQLKKFNEIGRLPSNQLKALETRLNEEYEKVEKTGKGRKIEFVCNNKRPELLEIVNANKGPSPSEMILALEKLLAMKMIENNHTHEGCFYFPVNKYMEEFEIADKRFCYYERNKTFQNKELEKSNVHREITEDVYNNLHSNFSNAIFRALKELKKKGLAKWYMLPYAKFYRSEVVKTAEDKIMEVDGKVKIKTVEEWYAPLDIKIAKRIDDKIKYLEERLNINYWIAKNGNHLNSEEFIRKYNEIHAFYGIRFKYDAYCSYLTKTERKVREKLDLPTTPEEAKVLFDIVAKKHNLKLAERRQTKGFGKVDRIVHQAKIDGVYVSQAEIVYDYMVDGKEFPNK